MLREETSNLIGKLAKHVVANFDWRLSGLLGLLAACLTPLASPARADYRVGAGDVVEIFVSKVPELQRRVTVSSDGSVTVPILGSLPVAGLSPAELQARIKTELATKVVQQRLPDGREIEVVINPDDVVASIVDYLPIYVNGDLSRPGEYPYRPTMTIRQAIAVAGGVELARNRPRAVESDLTDLHTEFTSLWIDLAREQAHVWRIKSELGVNDNVDPKSLMDVPLPQSQASQIVMVEQQQLEARNTDFQRHVGFLKDAIKLEEDQIKVLTEQQKTETDGLQADTEELQKVMNFYERGALPNLRVSDARRAVLLSSTRKLQTVAQLMEVKRRQEGYAREMEKLTDQRRIDLLAELQQAEDKISALKVKLEGVGEKIQIADIRSLPPDNNDFKLKVTIIRRGTSGYDHIAAEEDAELRPGDVVTVTVRKSSALQASDKPPVGEAAKN